MSTFERLKSGLIDYLGADIDASKVTPDAHLRSDLGLDSLDEACVEMVIEEEFQIDVPDGASDDWHTVADVIAFIDSITTDASGVEQP